MIFDVAFYFGTYEFGNEIFKNRITVSCKCWLNGFSWLNRICGENHNSQSYFKKFEKKKKTVGPIIGPLDKDLVRSGWDIEISVLELVSKEQCRKYSPPSTACSKLSYVKIIHDVNLISTFVVVYINTYADSMQNQHCRNLQDVFTDGSLNALVMEQCFWAPPVNA